MIISCRHYFNYLVLFLAVKLLNNKRVSTTTVVYLILAAYNLTIFIFFEGEMLHLYKQ